MQAFNSMLRDYAGAEMYALEFELVNYTTEYVDTRLYPRTMILIPGKHKDAENLLVALRAEQATLDAHLAHQDMLHICSSCWEIEEAADIPSLTPDAKSQVIARFVQRFARRIQGLLIEGKWSRKLIGIKGKDPTDSEDIASISSVKVKKRVRWDAPTPIIEPYEPSYSFTVPDFREEKLGEFYKVMISGPSAYFIAQNTFKLAGNLLQLANLGTVNDGQSQIIQLALKVILGDLSRITTPQGPEEAMRQFVEGFERFYRVLDEFQSIGIKFSQEGQKGSFQNILSECAKFFSGKEVSNKELMQNVLEIFIESCKQSLAYKLQTPVRSSDLKSDLNFFVESSKIGLELVSGNLHRYLSLLLQREFLDQFVSAVKKMLDAETKPARELGMKFLEKIRQIIAGDLAYEHLFHLTNKHPKITEIGTSFKNSIRDNLSKYFEEVEINLGDLLAFAESMVEGDTAPLKEHVTKLANFSQQIDFLYAYILRHSSINRFISEYETQIKDPVTFATLFHEFLRKRVSSLVTSGVSWANHVLDWILEFRDLHSSKIDARRWEKGEILKVFLQFLEAKVTKETNPANFLFIMDKYTEKMPPNTRPASFSQLMQKFEESVGIKKSFPDYLRGRLLTLINEIGFEITPRLPASYFQNGEKSLYYDFLENHALKHFARLQAIPKTLTLRSTTSNVDHQEIFYVIEFQSLQKRLNIDVKTNWVSLARIIK